MIVGMKLTVRHPKMIAAVIGAVLLAGLHAAGQTSEQVDSRLEDKSRHEVIDSVLHAFELHYVYPDVAKNMCDQIRRNYDAGAYDTIADLSDLTRQLTRDMRDIAEDRHIWISVMSPDDFSPAIGDTITQDKIDRRRKVNFGFRDVKWLPGNVGYVRFDQFDHPSYAGETAAAAMNFLANCDAVIVDLRYNHGGEENMVQFIASYFYQRPRELNSLYFTETDSLEQSWTYAFVPGKKPVDADLYILTSHSTGSGAEAFAYGMKHQGRATIIGETTAGAAHWSEYYDFPDLGVRVMVPIARPINPVTKTSWERVGVTPNIETSAQKALETAQVDALKNLLEKATDDDSRRDLRWYLAAAEAGIDRPAFTEKELEHYTGEYADGRYAILVKDGLLFWRYVDGTEFRMVPLTADLFGFEDDDDYRIRIFRDNEGKVSGFQLLTRQGDESPVRPRTGDI
jgi:hypothetical protein